MAVLHPLAGLLEFADIHHQYQRNSTLINLSSAWKANFEVLSEEIHPDTSSISNWINNVEKSVQGLTLAKVQSDVINGAVCWNTLFRHAMTFGSMYGANCFKLTCFNPTSTSPRMQTRRSMQLVSPHHPGHASSRWCNRMELQHSLLLCKCSKCTPTLSATTQAALPLVWEISKGGAVKCKIHHPGGLDKCPHYEETKTIIAESKQKFWKMRKKGGKGGKKEPDRPPN
eukprot:2249450-Rhodomonas_salina.2